MLISEFDYELPPDLIAQHPLEERDASRMLVLARSNQKWTDAAFRELPDYLRPGDLVVVNNTRVFPARLMGKRTPSGGAAELFLVRETGLGEWEALARPARRLRNGDRIDFCDGRLTGEIIEELPEGRRRVRFAPADSFLQTLDDIGLTPLPPYIRREDGAEPGDRDRYQTVYARRSGAIAAPTAGLHFTPEVFERLRQLGAGIAEITLHVGYGTFEPVRVEDTAQHQVAEESFEIAESAAVAINLALAEGRRIVAVGTTTVRALESACAENGRVRAGADQATITIVPGYEFRAVGAMLTNFHLPKSSLLLLVSAFAGRELALAAYRHAVANRYRFYSYGDCMLII
jgi:S-adenosylmethionine:tRNA ribosyltransferase-isomerase